MEHGLDVLDGLVNVLDKESTSHLWFEYASMKTFLSAGSSEAKKSSWEKKNEAVWKDTYDELMEEFFDTRGSVTDRDVAVRNDLLDLFDNDYVEYVHNKIQFLGMEDGVPEIELFCRGPSCPGYKDLMADYTTRCVNTAWATLKDDRKEDSLLLKSQIR